MPSPHSLKRYFEGDAASSFATHASFLIYFTSFIIYFHVSANEQDQEGHGARYFNSDDFKNGALSGSLVQFRPNWVFYFNLGVQLLTISRLIFWFVLLLYGNALKLYVTWFHAREVGKTASLAESRSGEDRRSLEATTDYVLQKKVNLEALLAKSIGGLKNGASLLEWTNLLLTVMVLLPLADWETYKYLWLPTFLHIWHAKFFLLIMIKDRMTAIEAKNDAMSYRTKVYYDTIDLTLNVLSYIATWVRSCL